MNAHLYKTTGRWRVIIPPRLTETGKRKCRFFKTKEEADAEIDRLKDQETSRVLERVPANHLNVKSDTLLSPLDDRKVLSVTELAGLLNLDTETIRRDLWTGAIPGGFQRKPGGQWRIRRSVLEAWWACRGLK